MPMTPAELGKLIADETENWAKVILNSKHGADFIGEFTIPGTEVGVRLVSLPASIISTCYEMTMVFG